MKSKFLILALGFLSLFLVKEVAAKTFYLDSVLTSNCNGTYSVANRDNSGSDGDAYNNIQDAMNALQGGDTMIIRQGSYSRTGFDPRNPHEIGALDIGWGNSCNGTPSEHTVVMAFPGEQPIILAEWGKANYNPDPGDLNYTNSSEYYNNPAIGIHGSYIDVTGLKTYGQTMITSADIFSPSHDILLADCDLGGGGPHCGQGMVVGLNYAVYDVIIRNNKIHNSCWGENDDNGSAFMSYHSSVIIENNEFYDNWGGDVYIKDAREQYNRNVVIRNNFFRPSSIYSDSRGVIGLNQEFDLDSILIYNNVFLQKVRGVQWGTLDVLDMKIYPYLNTFIDCGTDLFAWGSTHSLRSHNNLFYHSNNNSMYYSGYNVGNIEGNLFYSTSNQAVWELSGTPSTTLAAWQTRTGVDLISVYENPLFINASGSNPGDFKRQDYSGDVTGGVYGPVCGAYVTGNEIIGLLSADADTFTLTVNNGSGTGEHPVGSLVYITANTPPAGQVFYRWTGDVDNVANVNDPTTTITMPAANTTITATYITATYYTLTVNSGEGDTTCAPGTVVTIIADAPPAGQVFDQWTGDTDSIANPYAATTTITMPAANASITATYNTTTPPQGGLSESYPGDVGIENDPSVLYVEKFDDNMTSILSRYDDLLNTAGMSLDADVPSGSPGGYSIEMTSMPGNAGGHLFKNFGSGFEDSVFIRYYVKYPSTSANYYHHEGVWFGGYNPDLEWPNPQAGTCGLGDERLNIAYEPSYPPTVGGMGTYLYWEDMRSWNGSECWGNDMVSRGKTSSSGSPAPNEPLVDYDEWMCIEVMVKLNYPVTAYNGELKIWQNGVEVGHWGPGFPNGHWEGDIWYNNPAETPFEGFRWRTDTNLNINWIWFEYFHEETAPVASSINFDHFVMATQYIGPISTGGTTEYTLTVNSGSGDGNYDASTVVPVTADAPPSGYVFDQWTGDVANVADIYAASTTITMPAANATITATYEESTPTGNLALSRPVTASSTESGFPASNAVDGDAGTRWASGGNGTQWIYVELDATYSINHVVLEWEDAYSTQYQIQVSDDGNYWTDVYSTTTGDGGTDDITFSPVSARYVRMYSTMGVGPEWGISPWEFEVYGESTPTTYTLTVNSGTGNGSYAASTVVPITADAPQAGYVFDRWTGDVANVADIYAASTTITMPASNTAITAIYTISGSGSNLTEGVITGVGSTWQTITLSNTYSSMVVICAVNYDNSDLPAVARVRNASGNSFDLKVQNPNDNSLSGYSVYYMVVEEGVYTTASDGVQMEAVKYTSTVTDHASSWVGQSMSYTNTYSSPAVIGQVMSANDDDWSVFWARGTSAGDPPSSGTFYAGKNVGEDTDNTRSDETIGYIVIESGSGSIGDVDYIAAVGSNSIGGVTNSPPYNYSISGIANPSSAVVSAAGINGPNGGWPILYGSSPVTSSLLALAIDEDQISDSERNHISEQVAYIVMQLQTKSGKTVTGEAVESLANTEISIYPNPANSVLTIGGINGMAQIEIYSLSGAKCQTINNVVMPYSVDISEYLPGTYILKVVADGKSFMKKVVKE